MIAAGLFLFGGRLLEVHGGGVPSQRSGELGGDFAGAFRGDIGARTGLRNGVAESGDSAGFRVDADGNFFGVERFEVARHPDLHGAVALKERGCRAEREPLQEVLADQRIGAVPRSGGVSDVPEGGGVEAARPHKSV